MGSPFEGMEYICEVQICLMSNPMYFVFHNAVDALNAITQYNWPELYLEVIVAQPYCLIRWESYMGPANWSVFL